MNSSSAIRGINTVATALALILMPVGCAEQAPKSAPLPALCSEPWPDFEHLYYDALTKFPIPPERQQEYPLLFENGSLRSYSSLTTGKSYDVARNQASITELLEKVDGPDVSIGQQIWDDYMDKRKRMCGSVSQG
ncbi:hypothetical protein ACFXHA_15820 [Nocardia sp. NPDC059240]|uniref:hypothetical protein n=1 Tax=Nocardia sp. NPDC059240 TaxID=3346786 RepID=UPI00367F671A